MKGKQHHLIPILSRLPKGEYSIKELANLGVHPTTIARLERQGMLVVNREYYDPSRFAGCSRPRSTAVDVDELIAALRQDASGSHRKHPRITNEQRLALLEEAAAQGTRTFTWLGLRDLLLCQHSAIRWIQEVLGYCRVFETQEVRLLFSMLVSQGHGESSTIAVIDILRARKYIQRMK